MHTKIERDRQTRNMLTPPLKKIMEIHAFITAFIHYCTKQISIIIITSMIIYMSATESNLSHV